MHLRAERAPARAASLFSLLELGHARVVHGRIPVAQLRVAARFFHMHRDQNATGKGQPGIGFANGAFSAEIDGSLELGRSAEADQHHQFGQFPRRSAAARRQWAVICYWHTMRLIAL